MNNHISSNFLDSTIKLLQYYKSLGEKAFLQLSDEQLFYRPNENDNSIAIIVGHLHGNMLSRWTNFMHSDGEKVWRERDQEFQAIIKSKTDLIEKWEEGWGLVFAALKQLKPDDLPKTTYIRNMGHTVTEALQRQLAHYTYHVGQIVFYAKMQRGSDWKTLSIPKGNSKAYNLQKFSKDKKSAHFTTEFLDRHQDGG